MNPHRPVGDVKYTLPRPNHSSYFVNLIIFLNTCKLFLIYKSFVFGDTVIPTQLDLDWLHQAVDLIRSGRYRHRREGKTVAYVMLMIGETELGGPQNTYLYIGESMMLSDRVRGEFAKQVKIVHGVDAITRHTSTLVAVREQRFYFFSIRSLMSTPSLVQSIDIDRIFFDVDDAVQKRLDADSKLSSALQQLLLRLSTRRGDVI